MIMMIMIIIIRIIVYYKWVKSKSRKEGGGEEEEGRGEVILFDIYTIHHYRCSVKFTKSKKREEEE